jgi:hypothetical protein
MAACSRSMEKAYKNNKREFPKQPSWAMVAELLHAAKMYE